MTQSIAKGERVRVIATGEHSGKTGVIARQIPDDQPFGNPPTRPVRPPRRFRVVDFDRGVDLGWFAKWELEPYKRQPGDIPEHVQAAGRVGADLLRVKRREAVPS